MEHLDFYDEGNAKACRTFLEKLTGIEPLVSACEVSTEFADPDRIWRVSLKKATLTLDERSRLDVFLKHLSQERQQHLSKKREEYSSLGKQELKRLWDARDTLASDEIMELRPLIRSIAGVDTVIQVDTSVRTCPQCGMVGDNCTCTRSWF